MDTIPLFKTQYSIGKSILTSDDVVDIAKYNSLDKVVCVEDSFYGFRDIRKKLHEKDLDLVFGIKLLTAQDSKEYHADASKLIFFAKNNDGFKAIRSLYTDAFTNDHGFISLSDYKPSFFDNIKIAVPFYDSFVYHNIFNFGVLDLNLNDLDHIYFEENNKHPFDFQIKNALKTLGVETQKTKSIYYRNREDFHAFQMYKSVCNRRQGRPPTFNSPNLNDFCSEEFCWESYNDSVSI